MSVSVQITQRLGDFALDASFESEGGVTALFGPSGCGKTSIINAIAGLSRPDAGHVRLGDQVLFNSATGVFVPPHKRRIGYVFQEPRLFPHMSVAQNIGYGRPNQLYSTRGDGGLAVLGIEHLLERYPRDLSGGEAQRVAIARALTSQPKVLLMDEPLAALDDARKTEFLPYLQALVAKTSIPVFYVSHAMSEVAQLADHLVVMRDGRVARSGALAQLLSDPAAISDIGVREAGAILNVTVAQADASDGLSVLATSAGRLFLPKVQAEDGTAMRVRIRASDVILSKDKPDGLSALNILPCKVTQIHEGQGPGVAVALRSGEDALMARITRRSARTMGLTAGLSCYAVIKSVSVAPTDMGGRGTESRVAQMP
ncbi:molybdate transport system ATP-binding protein [Litoreibacter halocynthiae]|uniref:Molybdate transport system ATP-binding protein n=1 Tax=Litoreibacter halocynthiae TaxID=1242689 RepID=A0A4R7LHJ8_9RHOB|nr:molybdenum ABC transporter ATP-binding protein [Litoreibacter halocynthiae]TDT75243.1 molybdate transport system ATP-binding protein [Litoreibacter halocynthiae]